MKIEILENSFEKFYFSETQYSAAVSTSTWPSDQYWVN
jgi:hypothetical protein